MSAVYILIVSLLACAIVGSLVMARRGFHDRTTIVYGLLTAALSFICIMNSLAVMMNQNQLLYVRGVMGGTTVAMYLIYVLILELKERKNAVSYLKTKLLYATLAMLIIDFTDLLFTGVTPGTPPKPIPNIGIIFFFGLYIVTLLLGISQLRKDMTYAKTVSERRSYQLLIAGIVPIIFLAPLTSFVLPNFFGISQFVMLTPLYAFTFVMCVGYAIVRHGLFDVKRAVVRTATYALSLASLAIVYYVMTYTVSIVFFDNRTTQNMSLSPVNILLAITLGFIFQPIRRFFDKVTNSLFYRDAYKNEDVLMKLSNLLTSTTDLRRLLSRTSQELASTFKAEYVSFHMHYTNAVDHHVSVGTPGYTKMSATNIKVIDEYLAHNTVDVLIAERMAGVKDIYRILLIHKIALIIPLRKGGQISGYLIVGDHLTSNYTKKDINFLLAISNELVIAIQNALSIHEVKEINAHLQQRIDEATKELRTSNIKLRHLDQVKDEFMSMASHQLRTPLTSVKGYMSMVLEGDAGEITSQQRHLLTEAFKSSERMVHLIADFLSVSRLQTGKFVLEQQEGSLEEVVKQEVDTLTLVAKSHNLELIYKHPEKSIPRLAFDEAKMRQVIMNFIDNAIYYSRSNTTITIALELDTDQVLFTVTDTGIGVPKDEQHQLFTKFFRAKNARRQRPDGTGVGLFLAKKVVTAHGGSIIFHSIEGKGSTFGFRLPIVAKSK